MNFSAFGHTILFQLWYWALWRGSAFGDLGALSPQNFIFWNAWHGMAPFRHYGVSSLGVEYLFLVCKGRHGRHLAATFWYLQERSVNSHFGNPRCPPCGYENRIGSYVHISEMHTQKSWREGWFSPQIRENNHGMQRVLWWFIFGTFSLSDVAWMTIVAPFCVPALMHVLFRLSGLHAMLWAFKHLSSNKSPFLAVTQLDSSRLFNWWPRCDLNTQPSGLRLFRWFLQLPLPVLTPCCSTGPPGLGFLVTLLWTRGPSFTSSLWSSSADSLGMWLHYTSAYQPQANSFAEHVLFRDLKTSLHARLTCPFWSEQIPWALQGLRSAIECELSCSAVDMFFWHSPLLPGELFRHAPLCSTSVSPPASHHCWFLTWLFKEFSWHQWLHVHQSGLSPLTPGPSSQGALPCFELFFQDFSCSCYWVPLNLSPLTSSNQLLLMFISLVSGRSFLRVGSNCGDSFLVRLLFLILDEWWLSHLFKCPPSCMSFTSHVAYIPCYESSNAC